MSSICKGASVNKKNTGRFYIIIGIIWVISAIINAANVYMHFLSEKPLGVVYICLTLLCIFLAIFYITMGIKKKN